MNAFANAIVSFYCQSVVMFVLMLAVNLFESLILGLSYRILQLIKIVLSNVRLKALCPLVLILNQ